MTETSLLIQPLEEEVTYTFMVRAQTIDFGPSISGNVTTGPQEGSPMEPSNLGVTKTVSSVELQWINGASGKGPILGFYIETRRKGKYMIFTREIACYIYRKELKNSVTAPIQNFLLFYTTVYRNCNRKYKM